MNELEQLKKDAARWRFIRQEAQRDGVDNDSYVHLDMAWIDDAASLRLNAQDALDLLIDEMIERGL